jgi:DNA-binding LacI/PurR family transcriptional regulator
MLPFSVNRDSKTSLTEQIETGFRQAIQTSHFKQGDSLPTLQEMADGLDVSMAVVRTAIRRLSRDGLVTARPSRGIQVCPSGQHRWQAHVLYLHWGTATSFYEAVISETVMNQLLAKQILVTPIQLNSDELTASYPRLNSIIHAGSIDLAALSGSATGIDVYLAENEIPFIQMAIPAQPSRLARRMIMQDSKPALEHAAKHVVGCGVRSMMIVTINGVWDAERNAFESTGIPVRILVAKPNDTLGQPAAVELGGLESVARWLESGEPLPDLIYFADDYLARGGLTALLERGIRIPDDVQVISWTNRNFGPVFSKPLTRIEMDPVRDGEAMVDLVMKALKKTDRKVNEPVVIGPEFIVGDTTRSVV